MRVLLVILPLLLAGCASVTIEQTTHTSTTVHTQFWSLSTTAEGGFGMVLRASSVTPASCTLVIQAGSDEHSGEIEHLRVETWNGSDSRWSGAWAGSTYRIHAGPAATSGSITTGLGSWSSGDTATWNGAGSYELMWAIADYEGSFDVDVEGRCTGPADAELRLSPDAIVWSHRNAPEGVGIFSWDPDGIQSAGVEVGFSGSAQGEGLVFAGATDGFSGRLVTTTPADERTDDIDGAFFLREEAGPGDYAQKLRHLTSEDHFFVAAWVPLGSA